MKQEEKMKQIAKEAKAVLYSMVAIVVFWIVSGLGVSKLDISIYHTPLWVITGCLGTWVFAIVLVTWLMNHVFKNFNLDDEKELEKEND